MSWFLSIAVAIANAFFAATGSHIVCNFWLKWHRVSHGQGAHGLYSTFATGMGFIGGGVLGLIVARVVAAHVGGSISPVVSVVAGSTIAILGLWLTLVYATADFVPMLDGKKLAVAVEVRGARNMFSDIDSESSLTLTQATGRQRQSIAVLRPADSNAPSSGNTDVLSAIVDLDTSSHEKWMGVQLSGMDMVYLMPKIPGKPTKHDQHWSPWETLTHDWQLRPLKERTDFEIRYRVQLREENKPAASIRLHRAALAVH